MRHGAGPIPAAGFAINIGRWMSSPEPMRVAQGCPADVRRIIDRLSQLCSASRSALLALANKPEVEIMMRAFNSVFEIERKILSAKNARIARRWYIETLRTWSGLRKLRGALPGFSTCVWHLVRKSAAPIIGIQTVEFFSVDVNPPHSSFKFRIMANIQNGKRGLKTCE